MTEPMTRGELAGYDRRPPATARRGEPANLADILERVLDKGIVIAGDIQVNLLDIELLTIKLRLVVASVDRAKEMGIDWWEHDPTLSSHSRAAVEAEERAVAEENRLLRERVAELEAAAEPYPREAGYSTDAAYADEVYEEEADSREAPPRRRERRA